MAITRDEFFDAKAKGALWDVGVSIKRGNPLPIDADSVFSTFEEAQSYAAGVLSYPGQVLAVVAEDETTIYYLDNNCSLVEVDGKVLVDGKSIIIDSETGVISIKGVDAAENGAVLTRSSDGSVSWIKPDTTTIEGLSQKVEEIDGRLEQVETTLGDEGSGLVKQVNDLSTNLADNYYTKVQVDGLVSGAFHFRGEAEKFEDGNIYIGGEILDSMKPGDVYQVSDKEYAYTGTEWIELGFNVDLSNYATQSWTTQQINTAKTELQGYTDQAEIDAINASKAYTDKKILPLATSESVTQAINEAKTELKSYTDQAETDAINTAGTNADSKIAAKVGELGAEYPTVKSYVDAKDSVLDGKISSINTKLDNLGALASLDEVSESNLSSALKSKIDGKADKSTTLAGYGIEDAYTKVQTDSLISTAKDEAISTAGTQTDSKIAAKVGNIGSDTVKQYVDNKELTINSKINTIQQTIDSYGDIVTHNASDFDTKGSAAAVLGSSSDKSTANTVYGAKKGVEEAKQAASEALNKANEKVASITAADNSIIVSGTTTKPKLNVKLDPDENNALKLTASGLKVELQAAPEYTIEKEAAATEGYFASYVLKKDGVQSGVKIDIPKDYLVKSASIKNSIGEGDPSGLPLDTKYIDFVINAKDADGTESHIYLNVNDLVDVYTNGNGIEISPENIISLKIVNENGLTLDSSGLKMNLATGSSSGAMSSKHFTKLEGIEESSQKNILEGVQVNGSDLAINNKKVNIPIATATSLGLVKGSTSENQIQVKANGIMEVNSVNVNKLVQTEGELLILDCGDSTSANI